MLIGFNADMLSSPALRGWNRYSVNLLAELPALGCELILYSRSPLHTDHLRRFPSGSYKLRPAPCMRYAVWEQHWLPRQAAIDRVDLLHSPHNFGLPWRGRFAKVLTLHDAIDVAYQPEAATFLQRLAPSRLKSEFHFRTARNVAHAVLTVSEHARNDLVKWFGLPADKITAVPNAADARFGEPVGEELRKKVREAFGLSEKFIFYVGGFERRKNLPFLLRGLAKAELRDVDLVLGGGKNADLERCLDLARTLGLEDRIEVLGFVDDALLPALYAEALCFVYPSEYEGFGLQAVEAMAAGCPLIAADATSLPEVVGDGGVLVPLNDDQALADALRKIAEDPARRAALSAQGRRRAGDFSWEKSAQDTVAVYCKAIERAAY